MFYLALGILILTWGGALRPRSERSFVFKYIFIGGIILIFGFLFYQSWQLYQVWWKFLLPPYQPIRYFFFYCFTNFFEKQLIALGAALLFLAAAFLLNKKFQERFFEKEEPYLGALAIFLVGHPWWIYYIIVIGLIGVIGTLYLKIKQFKQSEPHPNLQTNPNGKIIEKELSYKLVGLFYKTQDALGRFAKERQYGDFLEKILKENNIKFKREQLIPLNDKNSNFIDFLIEDKILVELKAKPWITKEDYYQTKRYLEFSNLELGLIVNFREKLLHPKRILNPKVRSVSDYSLSSDNVRIYRFPFYHFWLPVAILVLIIEEILI
jgi:GxxExxY protein